MYYYVLKDLLRWVLNSQRWRWLIHKWEMLPQILMMSVMANVVLFVFMRTNLQTNIVVRHHQFVFQMEMIELFISIYDLCWKQDFVISVIGSFWYGIESMYFLVTLRFESENRKLTSLNGLLFPTRCIMFQYLYSVFTWFYATFISSKYKYAWKFDCN